MVNEKKGTMPPPDFGLYLSCDRFERLLRYWAFGPDKCWGELLEKPWTEVQYWVRGFNKSRRDELEVGTDLTPDEMMFAWRKKKGNGGIPHLSLVERKPIPLGTELKCVCEGTFGLCMHLEIQTGKISMARKKWCRQYKATTACTVRLLDNMQVRATNIEEKKRCVFADSWFASVETALAVRTELVYDFTGPIKTAHKYFPLEHIWRTLSEMKRGEHIVFKCNMKRKICGRLGGMTIITRRTLQLMAQPTLGNLQTKKGKIRRQTQIFALTFLVLKFWQNTIKKWVP